MGGSLRAHHNDMRKLMSIAVVAASLLTGSARAVEIENLYGGQAIVAGMFEPERTRGLRQVLLDVLVKVSAEPKLIDDPRVQPLLDRAKDFMTSYEYEDRMKGTPVRDEQGTRDRPHDLRIKFDPAKIDAALAELGLKSWTSDRPILLAWITIEYPGRKFILRKDGQDGLGQKQALEAAAIRRGMKILVGEDFTIYPPLSTKPDETYILKGTLRWQPDKVSWHTNWQLTNLQKERSWSVDSPSFDEAFRNGVGEAAATLAGRR
ncbi:MAG: DUF2066 domain-containing protein [Reyranellaceae bacterium]